MLTIAPLLTFIANRNLVDIGTREVIGNNIPHVLIVRTPQERIEQAESQFGNTVAFFGGGFLLNKALKTIQDNTFKKASMKQLKWLQLSRSFGLYALLGSLIFASPQFRNLFTLKRTGATQFSEMIGEKKQSAQNSLEQQALVAKEKHQCITKIKKSLATGAGLAAFFLGLGGLFAAKKTTLPKWMEAKLPVLGGSFLDKVSLKDGKFKNLPDMGAILSWVLTTYVGLFIGARDKYEKAETAIRFGAYMASFFILPNAMRHLIEKPLKQYHTKFFGSGDNIAWGAKFLTSSLLCSAMPSFVNIALTHWRVKRDGKKVVLAAPKVASPLYQNNRAVNPLSGSTLQTPYTSQLQPSPLSLDPARIVPHSYIAQSATLNGTLVVTQ
jgi:hypothetical protein